MAEDPVQTARFAAANEIVGFLFPRVHSERITLLPNVASAAHAAARLSPLLAVADPRGTLTPGEVLSLIESLRAGQTRKIAPDQEAIPTVFYERLGTDLDVLDFTRFEARNHLELLLANWRRKPGTLLWFSKRLIQLTTCCAQMETVEAKCRAFFAMVLKHPVPPVPDQVTSFIETLTAARRLRMLHQMPLDPFVVFDHPSIRTPGAWRDHLRVPQEDPPMTKIVLRRPPPPDGIASASDQNMLASLEQRKAEMLAAEHDAQLQREAAERPVRETVRALKLASFARGEYDGEAEVEGVDPIGIRHRAITIGNEEWATRIIATARAWATHPGFDALHKRPVRGSGLGMDAGQHIFERAAAPTVTISEIAALVEGARKRLGVARGDRNHDQSELGIWNYLRQMAEDFGRGYWRALADRLRPTTPGFDVADSQHPDRGSSAITRHASAYLITFRGASFSIAHGEGVDRLVHLLLHSGKTFSATDLLAAGEGNEKAKVRAASWNEAVEQGLAGPSTDDLADAEALRQYDNRLRDIRADIETAQGLHDEGTVARLQAEKAGIESQVRAALGPKGGKRKLDPERRKHQERVAKSIGRALEQLPGDLRSFLEDGRLKLTLGANLYAPKPGDGPEAVFRMTP